MGYTTAVALHRLRADGQLVVAELVPAVVKWNRGPLADLAGRPLENDRVTVREVDIAEILRVEHGIYDAVLLDVDNGPEGLTQKGNDWLYSRAGLDAAFATLRPAGVLALDPGASECELSPVELRQGGGIAENRRGHVLRLGHTDSCHAASSRRQHVLRVGSVPLPTRDLSQGNKDDACDNGSEKTCLHREFNPR